MQEYDSRCRKKGLTLFFGIFILLATLFLAFVPTLYLNHRPHSFLGFFGLLESPHGGRAPSFAALLRLPGDFVLYVSVYAGHDNTKTGP